MISPETLAAIEARCEAATEGPWEVVTPPGRTLTADPLSCNVAIMIMSPEGSVICPSSMRAGELVATNGDWRFVSHAREDVPALIAEVKRLREAILDYIELDRVIGGCPQDEARALVLRENESVSTADFLRALGVPVGDYP